MAFRDLIPWSRQDNRLPVPVSAERQHEAQSHSLLALHREVNRLFDDVFRGVGAPTFGASDRGYSERSYGRFERRIGLPKGIDRDKASATFQNGVLTITLPKTEATNENVRRIPIHGKAA